MKFHWSLIWSTLKWTGINGNFLTAINLKASFIFPRWFANNSMCETYNYAIKAIFTESNALTWPIHDNGCGYNLYFSFIPFSRPLIYENFVIRVNFTIANLCLLKFTAFELKVSLLMNEKKMLWRFVWYFRFKCYW